MLWAARVVLGRLDPYRDEWLLSADKPLDEGAPHYERWLRSGATKHLFRFVEPATGTSNWRFLLGPTPGEGGVHGHDIRNRRDAAHGAEMAGGRRVWLSRRRGVYVYGDARPGGWAAGTQTNDAAGGCEGVRAAGVRPRAYRQPVSAGALQRGSMRVCIAGCVRVWAPGRREATKGGPAARASLERVGVSVSAKPTCCTSV